MLELKNISKRFGEKQIISDLNLKVPEKANPCHCRTVWRRENDIIADVGWLGNN